MADAILTISGLPPQRTATLYDLLARYQRNGKWQSIPVRVVTVSDDGTLTITGLRDSRYALLFSDPKASSFSKFKLDVGDKTKYRSLYLSDPLPAPILKSVNSGIRLDNVVAYLEWTIRYDLSVVAFDIYRKGTADTNYVLAHSVPERTARTCELSGLQGETNYQLYLVARGSGLRSKPSNVIAITTPPLPEAQPNLIVNGNFETTTW